MLSWFLISGTTQHLIGTQFTESKEQDRLYLDNTECSQWELLRIYSVWSWLHQMVILGCRPLKPVNLGSDLSSFLLAVYNLEQIP